MIKFLLSCLLGAALGGGVVYYLYVSDTPKPEPITAITPPAPDPYEGLPSIQVSPTKPHGEKITDIRSLTKGFDFESTVDITPGDTASAERMLSESYVARLEIDLKEPTPALTADHLTHAAPLLLQQLPGLSEALPTATVHPYWHTLYGNKKQRTVNSAHHLLKLLTKHNYYDCNTVLNLQHPESKRKALLIQSDMDVVADGSDGDRLPSMPDEIVNSTYYQPTTSYSWAKQTDTPNPMVAGFIKRMGNAEKEIAAPSTTSERRKWLKERKQWLKRSIDEMNSRSFLIAEYDPFIVLPVPIIVDKSAYSPNVGDYAVVFHGDRVFPAIVGDAGPDYKMGEASVRLAREISADAGPYHRPVSDLSVSYLVFPGSRKQPHRAPDYDDIHAECTRLLSDFGGLAESSSLHQWEDLLPASQTAAAPAPQTQQ